MSIIAWIARRLRVSNNEVPVNYKAIIDIYKDIHERANDRLKASYEKEISELRQEMKTVKDEAHEWERQLHKEHLESLDIQSENVSLLYELAVLRETVSAKTSLDIIDSIYRRRLEGPLSPDPQSVLSAIINGALDSPWHNYAYSRKKAISFVGSVLSENAVDKAGHDLYNTCCHRLPRAGYSKPIVIRKGQISPPSVAAFFALAHFCCRADIQVEYHSRDRIVNWPSHY